ncbi:DivIVA domain-containing protein [Ruminococcus sp. HUN007]|uniref:DivIVA domain-containing protein n=1 Tax=Ruminococcus sp. HUN007 TaxID=1514668 RepID=UPI000678E0A1|nr:DivIVA domain-containing protein [Ruminococcus sp. HUN007]
MIKAKDINSQRFEKAAFGYKQEDVDTFLSEIAADYAQLMRDNEDINAKLQVLADKVREYRKDEEAVKDALLIAQKEGHRVVSEAQERADELLRNAKLESDRMVNEATSDTKKAIEEVKDELKREQKNLAYLQKQVSAFKKNLFDVYKSHLEMISSLPQSDDEDEDDDDSYTADEPKTTIMETARDILTETAAVMEAAAKEQTGHIPAHTGSAVSNTGSIPVHTGSIPVQTSANAEKHEDGEKPDPFRTQSIPIIGESKYSELQFGQQNNNK